MKIINFLVYAVIKSFLFFGGLIPPEVSLLWLRPLSRIAYRFAKGRRALMLFNLEQALGDTTTPEEREQIARKSFENIFIAMAELMHMDYIYRHLDTRLTVEGKEHVQQFIDQGKGFFAFGGHFGGWTSPGWFPLIFPGMPGYNMVARPLRNPQMQSLFDYIAEKFGGKIITTRGTGDEIVEAAARGEMIGLYMDQESRRKQGVFVNFFGREASSHVVPGYLSWKHDIPLIPFWIPRTKPAHFHIIFRAPLQVELTEDRDENNRRVTQAIMSEVERTIREQPDQWLWAHNRWRRRPDGTKINVFEKHGVKDRKKKQKRGDYLSSADLAKKKQAQKEAEAAAAAQENHE